MKFSTTKTGSLTEYLGHQPEALVGTVCFCCWDRVPSSPGWPCTPYGAEDVLTLLISLPQPPECCYDRCVCRDAQVHTFHLSIYSHVLKEEDLWVPGQPGLQKNFVSKTNKQKWKIWLLKHKPAIFIHLLYSQNRSVWVTHTWVAFTVYIHGQEWCILKTERTRWLKILSAYDK